MQTKYKEKKKRDLCISIVNFYALKMKKHLPAVNLRFFTAIPNLTSNFKCVTQCVRSMSRRVSRITSNSALPASP